MAVKTSYAACCYNEQRKRLYVAAIPDDLARGEEETAAFVLQKGTWGMFQLEGIRVRSMTSEGDESWVVGHHGEIWRIPAGSAPFEKGQLPDSGHADGRRLGPPNQIRRVGERLYVCGFAGQVYTQDGKGKWVHMDDGLAEKGPMTSKSLSLEGLAGTASTRLFACGSKGTLARWNGKTWSKIPLLTNENLWAIRAFAKDDIWAVGDDGVVVRGDGDKQWAVSEIPGNDDSPLMDVEVYKGRVYVAAIGVLYVLDGDTWTVVKHGLPKGKTEFYKLTVGDGRLWAMGTKRISSFDGKKWQSHPDPDNG